MEIHVDIDAGLLALQDRVKPDRETKTFANTALARYCAPYVPMRTGILSGGARVTEECVTYAGPYAHYQYVGEVYGPNIPVRGEGGLVIGWFSPPGQPKHPTGRRISYRQDFHPLAQSHWDAAAMAVHRQDLADEIGLYMAERLRGG